jgi:hypothetical protein
VAAIGGLDSRDVPIAEVWRRSCDLAELIGVSRPSYEQIRRLVHRERRIRDLSGGLDLVADVLSPTRSPVHAMDELIERSLARQAQRATIARERSWRPAGRAAPVTGPSRDEKGL